MSQELFGLQERPTISLPGGYISPYVYVYHGSAPGELPTEGLARYEKVARGYIKGRLEQLPHIHKHDIAHRILGEMGLVPWDNFGVPELILADKDDPNILSFSLNLRKIATMPGNEYRSPLSAAFTGYLENPKKIPFLYNTIIKATGKFGLKHLWNDRQAMNFLEQYPEVKELYFFYYDSMDHDVETTTCIRQMFSILEERTGLLVRYGEVKQPSELYAIKRNPDYMFGKEKDRYLIASANARASWTSIVSEIKNCKIEYPQVSEPIFRYSARNMFILFEMSVPEIAHYLEIPGNRVIEYIREDPLCQKLPQMKASVANISPDRFESYTQTHIDLLNNL